MKKILLIFGLMSLFVLVTAMSCDDDDDVSSVNCEQRLQSLADLKLTIQTMANTSICSEEFECRYIPFGSKPCGGPWGFLVYSTSVDTLALTSLVEEYNLLETDYNNNCNAISDCSVPQPPIGFECENNQCIPIY